MPVFSKLRSFFWRHKNKFIVSGVIISSTILLTKYMQHRLRDWQEKETREFLDRTRKQSHFESINRTCSQTVLNLSSSLLESVSRTVDTDQIIEDLKKNPGNKIDKWNNLKDLVFVKSALCIYSLVMLVVTLKVQLNILGGYIYRDTLLTTEIQQKYLSLCQSFLNVGVAKLSKLIQIETRKILEHIDLKKQLKLSDIEAIFWSLQSSLASSKESPIDQLRSYIIDQEITESDDIYNSMLRDTADLLESDEVKSMVIHYVNRGFYVLGDQLSEFFTQNGAKITELPASNGTEPFENPYGTKKPVAKLIPIINGLLYKQSFPQNFIHILLNDGKINTLGANVYESMLV